MSVACLGIDGAWGGTGWSLYTGSFPAFMGWQDFSKKETRMVDLARYLETQIKPRLPTPLSACRVVIEDCPPVYSGASRGKAVKPELSGPISAGQARLMLEDAARAPANGNQAITCHRLGMIVGAISLWATMTGLPEPLLVPVASWRSFWSIRAKSRKEYKASAIKLVKMLYPQAYRYLVTLSADAQGDVAEAILLSAYGSQLK